MDYNCSRIRTLNKVQLSAKQDERSWNVYHTMFGKIKILFVSYSVLLNTLYYPALTRLKPKYNEIKGPLPQKLYYF